MKSDILKILHVIPNLKRAGGERICLDICNGLVKKGHNVILVILENINEYPELSKNIDIKFIPSKFTPSLLKKNYLDIKSLQLFVDDFNPNIIHSHLLEAEFISLQLKTPETTKFFNHIHGLRPELKKNSFKRLSKKSLIHSWEKKNYLKLIRSKSVKHFAISNKSLHFYEEIVGVNKSQLIHMPNCIDFNKFKGIPKKIKPEKPYLLITIGRLIPSKGHTFLLDVLKKLLDKKLKINLLIIGDGPEKKSILNKAKELNINNNINLIKATNHPEKYLKNSDLYLHSSYREAFGLVILEAMATGLPVVCTDAMGNRELIKEGKNGYLIWDRDSNDFALTIEKLLNDKKEYNLLSKNAIEFASGFDVSEYVEKLINYYQKV